MKKALFSILALFALSGCGLVNAIDESDPTLKADFIRVTASVATSQGLIQGYDGNELAEQTAAAQLIVMTVDTVKATMAEDENGIQVGDYREIVGLWDFRQIGVPPEVKFALSAAMGLMLSKVRPVALDELVTDEELLFLLAFLDGIREGAAPFLEPSSD